MERQFTTSFFVRSFHIPDGWKDLGEFGTMMEAELFYTECVLLGRFPPRTLTDIVRRDVDVDDLDYIVEEEIERRMN